MTKVELTVMVHEQTEKALLISDDGQKQNAVWLPKKQVRIKDRSRGSVFEIEIDENLALEKGLI